LFRPTTYSSNVFYKTIGNKCSKSMHIYAFVQRFQCTPYGAMFAPLHSETAASSYVCDRPKPLENLSNCLIGGKLFCAEAQIRTICTRRVRTTANLMLCLLYFEADVNVRASVNVPLAVHTWTRQVIRPPITVTSFSPCTIDFLAHSWWTYDLINGTPIINCSSENTMVSLRIAQCVCACVFVCVVLTLRVVPMVVMVAGCTVHRLLYKKWHFGLLDRQSRGSGGIVCDTTSLLKSQSVDHVNSAPLARGHHWDMAVRRASFVIEI